MKIPCKRCSGDGHLPQYEWNKAGICFTCNGSGTVNTFSTSKLNRLPNREEVKSYLTHSSNRDIAETIIRGEVSQLEATQLAEFTREFKRRAEQYYGMKGVSGATPKDAKEMLAILDEREKNMPKTHEKSGNFKAGKVSMVPVHWLQKFQGNNLRRDDAKMKEFAEQLLEEGLKEPVMIMIGQADRSVAIGEGNHRTMAFIEAGLDYVPARVSRNVNSTGTPFKTYYDKMSRVPMDDYFKADASPDEVFDTYYDHDDVTPLNSKMMKIMGHEEVELKSLDGKKLDDTTVKGIFEKKGKKVSKSANKQLDDMIEKYLSLGGSLFEISEVLSYKAGDWKSKPEGILEVNVAEAIAAMDEIVSDLEYEAIKKQLNEPKGSSPNWDEMDLDDIDIDDIDFDDLDI